MDKLSMNMEFCYGINKLNKELDFENRTFAIYAPNGVMKTSFAKTFDDIATGNETKDLAFPSRTTIVDIKADGDPIPSENVFVIQSYNADFKSDRMSTLLADQKLRSEYEDTHKEIGKALASFNKAMKSLSGISGRKESVEETIERVFGESFYDFMLSIEDDVSKSDPQPFSDVKYQDIFKDKVVAFLKAKDISELIHAYIEKYDQLVAESPYLGEKFKFHQAENVQKELLSNNFFDAGHSVSLFDGEKRTEYEKGEDLEAVLEEEKKKVFDDEQLEEVYAKISGKMTNQELKDFREYLLENKELLPELEDLDGLARKLWTSYFVQEKHVFIELVEKYKTGQKEIQRIVSEASTKFTEWEKVIKDFNERFSHLPFHLEIQNKDDVILKSAVESIGFVFKEGEKERVYQDNAKEKGELLKVLSTGEQRALYILNIIFEVEARKVLAHDTIFVVDDIADSFDYKNKYAIIEYLKYISDNEKYFMLILTHNFDFYRTIRSRGVVPYKQCLIALKSDDEVKLENMQYINNPFINDWKKKLSDDRKLIASIPFVRNIIEYTHGNKNDGYLTLTFVLHHKPETDSITLAQIKEIFEDAIGGIKFPGEDLDRKVVDLIYATADDCLNAPEGLNLENKIVMAIAIRIIAEKYMFHEITNEEFLENIGSDQNAKLLDEYMKEFNNKHDVVSLLKRVNLMTPENIHVNSFMYEPILDMGDNELRELYTRVKGELQI